LDEVKHEFDSLIDLGMRTEEELAKIKDEADKKERNVKRLQKMFREKREVEWEKFKSGIMI